MRIYILINFFLTPIRFTYNVATSIIIYCITILIWIVILVLDLKTVRSFDHKNIFQINDNKF